MVCTLCGEITRLSSLATDDRLRVWHSADSWLRSMQPDKRFRRITQKGYFEVFLDHPEQTLHKALWFRSSCIAQSPNASDRRIDVRLAIGAGSTAANVAHLAEEKNKALQLAQQGFADLCTREAFLGVFSENPFSAELWNTLCILCDPFLIKLTPNQAEALALRLTGMSQKQIATQLNISQPAVFRRLRDAEEEPIKRIIDYFQYWWFASH